jgi:hypothetical protein
MSEVLHHAGFADIARATVLSVNDGHYYSKVATIDDVRRASAKIFFCDRTLQAGVCMQ